MAEIWIDTDTDDEVGNLALPEIGAAAAGAGGVSPALLDLLDSDSDSDTDTGSEGGDPDSDAETEADEPAVVVEDGDVVADVSWAAKKLPSFMSRSIFCTGWPKEGVTWEQTTAAFAAMADCRCVAAQQEISPTNGRLHHQCIFFFKKPVRPSHVRKAMEGVWAGAHMEKRRGTPQEAVAYCSKEETRAPGTGPYRLGNVPQQGKLHALTDAVPAVFAGANVADVINDNPALIRYRRQLLAHAGDGAQRASRARYASRALGAYGWQGEILARLTAQSDRAVLWIVDQRGSAGKSALATQLIARFDNSAILPGGSVRDLATNWQSKGCPGVVGFDLPRAKEGFLAQVMGLMESMKDGRVNVQKYESTTVYCDPIKIVVFSNSLPPHDKSGSPLWSTDRYDVVTLTLDGVDVTSEEGLPQASLGAWGPNERAALKVTKVDMQPTEWGQPAPAAAGNWQ